MHYQEDLNVYQNAYNKDFKFYDENQWYLAHYAKKLCYSIRNNNYTSVLSLGIGHRVVSEHILSEFDHSLESYTIIEGSEDIIANFLNNTGNHLGVTVKHSYFEEYDTNERCDVIEMGFVLEHVDDPELILKRFSKFLKPGGTLFVAVPNARSLHRLIGYEAGLLDNMYKLSPYDLQLGHKRYFDLNSITTLVLNSGYKIISRTGLMLKPITGAQIAKLNWDDSIIQALFKIGDDYPEIANCLLIEATI